MTSTPIAEYNKKNSKTRIEDKPKRRGNQENIE